MKTQTRHISDLLPEALQQLRDVAIAMDARRSGPAETCSDERPAPPLPAPTAAHLLLHRRSAA